MDLVNLPTPLSEPYKDQPNNSLRGEDKEVIYIDNLHLHKNKKQILSINHLAIKQREWVGLIGSSGSGKSSLLRCIAGLQAYEGKISSKGNIGMVFQQFNLFKNMNVWGNICYGPYIQGFSQVDYTARAQALLLKTGLAAKKHSYPHDLSGGQQQLVSIIRTLILQPDILLLDEPTSSLDSTTSLEVLRVITLLKEMHTTVLIASHELHFLKKTCDRMIFVEGGHIAEDQPTRPFFEKPDQLNLQKFLKNDSLYTA